MTRILHILLAAALLACTTSTAAARPHNVILFLSDDLGWTGLGCYGSDSHSTPNLDRLASRGVRFTDGYAACTVCSPSRAAILTGKYPARTRVTDWIPGQRRSWAKLRPPEWTQHLEHSHTTLAESFRAAGYATLSIGKWHLGGEPYYPEHQGFDLNIAGVERGGPPGGYYLPNKLHLPTAKNGDYLPGHLARLASEKIREWYDRPFLIYFPFYTVHTPIQGRKDLVAEYRQSITPGAKHANPDFAAMLEAQDQAVGSVLDTLEELGIDDHTIVIFTSDNGGLSKKRTGSPELKPTGITDNTPLRDGKGSPYEGGVRVPFIVRWPGVTPSGAESATPVSGIDLFPTLVRNLTDQALPADIDGTDILPVLKNPDHPITRPLFWHYPHYHAGGATPYSAVREGSWRLVEFFETGALELYNLNDDIGETNDLASQNPEKTHALHSTLIRWRTTIAAQIPTPNTDFDPEKEYATPTKRKR